MNYNYLEQKVNMTSEASAPKKIVLKPIIISNKKMVIKSSNLLTNVKFPKSIQQYKEEVIYASSACDFLKGESQEVVIVNRLNLLSKSCRTIARCTTRGSAVETTSDSVSDLIGQKNYETVLSALSSVFNEETKVRGILALLKIPKKVNTIATQTIKETREAKKDLVDVASQTVDSRLNMFVKEKQRKRIRRQPLTPYVVTENQCKLKKFVINIDEVKKELKAEKKEEIKESASLPDLKLVVDEDSNMSCGSVGNISLSSLPSVPGILDNANALLTDIDKVTDNTLNSTEITLRDGSVIMIPVKPEDEFHIATPEILKNVTRDECIKLICHQAFIDFKLCLQQDEDGYYPLHIAVLNNDADLVRRQCTSLRARHESVDLPAAGLTALHMAVRQNASVACTNILLQNGADPMLCDQERRCSLHLAAEADSAQLRWLLAYCDTHARSVLKNNLDFWRPEHESKTDEQLKRYLYNCVSEMFDEQGYTPLMTAAEAANPAHVALLAARAGSLIDVTSPDCGATALYRVVAKACLHAKETNATTTPEKFLKTIEILVEHGADPSIENHGGSSVNTLLTEFNISSLSMTIANKMTAMRHGPYANDKMNMMLYKHNDGRIGYKNINNERNDNTDRNVPVGLHAIITVDIPAKQGPRKDAKNVEKDTGQNTKSVKVGNSSSNEIVNANEFQSVGMNRISGIKDLKLENVVLKSVLPDKNVRLKEVSADRLRDAINSAKSETNISLNAKICLKDASDDNSKLQNVKLGSVVLKTTNVNVGVKTNLINKTNNDKNVGLRSPGGVSVKGVRDGNLGNVTLKRLHSGQMIAITHTKTEKTTETKHMKVVGIPQKTNRNFNIIQVNQPFKVLTKNIDGNVKGNDKTNLNVNEVNDDDTPRSSKERKTENVVIVENVPLNKEFALPNILKAGTSKTAKPRDIVISSPKVNNDVSPKMVTEKDDVEPVKKFRKRKICSE